MVVSLPLPLDTPYLYGSSILCPCFVVMSCWRSGLESNLPPDLTIRYFAVCLIGSFSLRKRIFFCICHVPFTADPLRSPTCPRSPNPRPTPCPARPPVLPRPDNRNISPSFACGSTSVGSAVSTRAEETVLPTVTSRGRWPALTSSLRAS